jgi:hypothetical protein
MSARATYWINLAVSAVVVALVVRWRLRFAFELSAINLVVEAVGTHLPHFARCLRSRKPLRCRRTYHRALNERRADLSDGRVVEDAIHTSNYHPGESRSGRRQFTLLLAMLLTSTPAQPCFREQTSTETIIAPS